MLQSDKLFSICHQLLRGYCRENSRNTSRLLYLEGYTVSIDTVNVVIRPVPDFSFTTDAAQSFWPNILEEIYLRSHPLTSQTASSHLKSNQS